MADQEVNPRHSSSDSYSMLRTMIVVHLLGVWALVLAVLTKAPSVEWLGQSGRALVWFVSFLVCGGSSIQLLNGRGGFSMIAPGLRIVLNLFGVVFLYRVDSFLGILLIALAAGLAVAEKVREILDLRKRSGAGEES